MPARVFTIPASTPFLPTLAKALLDGDLVPGFAPRCDALALSAATVYLPTRRAARAFGHAMLDALGAEAALLPRVVPLGDVDDEALAFEGGPVELLPAIDPAERRLALARLILKFAAALPGALGDRLPLVAPSPAAAIALADELARLFDDLTIAGVGLDALKHATLPELDRYWHISFEFLEIAHGAWKQHLVESGKMDAEERRDQMLAREAQRLFKSAAGPIIAAGSTGTLPVVAKLLAAIAQRPDGAVVLPGLDQMLDAPSFALIEGGRLGDVEIEPSPGHPQFGLKRLLDRLGVKRDEVVVLAQPVLPARERAVSQALRPMAAIGHEVAARLALNEISEAFQGVTVVEAADPGAEARAIAAALREALEHAEMRAALVTPDRTLARRVAAELLRWGIEVEDSAGLPLAESEAGRFARLAAEAAAARLAPVPLLALLRHPLADLGAPAGAVDCLEVAALRGPRPAPGAGLVRAIEDARRQHFHARDPRSRLTAADWEAALDLARRVIERFTPLLALPDRERVPLARLVEAHIALLAAIGLDFAATQRDDARTLAEALASLMRADGSLELSLVDYASALGHLLSDAKVYPPPAADARIRILGTLEARLLTFDRVVVGGVNEGTWPAEAHNDAWLNRPMRKKLGLDLPERRIGLIAHDFVQAAGAGELVLTRARRQEGVETVASRFLQRIKAVAPEGEWKTMVARGERLLSLARALEAPLATPQIARPAPRPPLAARPVQLSLTEIEALLRDPYTIYARHILKLLPLEPIDAEPDAAERGTLLHLALADFAKAFPAQLPPDALRQLIAIGRQAFAQYADFPMVTAVWWPRFERVARWFVGKDSARRRDAPEIFVETSGRIAFDIAGQAFTLSARADRIERRAEGLAIVDYKTGAAPTLRETIAGLAPQLPLEAAIARAGGFKQIPAGASVIELLVMRLSGGEPAGEPCPLDPAKASGEAKKLAERFNIRNLDDLADHSRSRLEALLTAFADPRTPYHSIPRPKWRGRFGDYDHLARIKEWSEGGGGIEP